MPQQITIIFHFMQIIVLASKRTKNLFEYNKSLLIELIKL